MLLVSIYWINLARIVVILVATIGLVVLSTYLGSKLFKDELDTPAYLGITTFGLAAVSFINLMGFLVLSGIIHDSELTEGMGSVFQFSIEFLPMFLTVIVSCGVLIFLSFWKIYSNYFVLFKVAFKTAIIAGVLLAPWYMFFI